jgi:hypothetical protein
LLEPLCEGREEPPKPIFHDLNCNGDYFVIFAPREVGKGLAVLPALSSAF